MFSRLRALLAPYWLPLRVVGTFIGLITVFFSLMTYAPIVERFDIGEALARVSAHLSWLLLQGFSAVAGHRVDLVGGTSLATDGFSVGVGAACSGAVPMMIYLAAVLAYPAGPRAKLLGAVLGLGVIYVANVLRVAALFLIGLYLSQYFHDTHVYVAQALVVCIAVTTWLFWAGRFAHAVGR